ncbi:hypothetical protein [Rhodovulum sulfidophilum]|uniref:hypothetical protein n=2 Tax=Rhodovulum sulfidophilum TaxID=35806 RepID=UPI000A5B1C74|nr:hypothetical protein [Rhodovulum sulfidophilum]MBL3562303.1 hypothetical protein [Rhodovulum sulfidophilum]MCE8420212.1 hypothetical protein [Rhodovulum sulfidophilum]
MTDKSSEKPAQLLDDPTPFSNRMNWPLLSSSNSKTELKTDDPTPLSSQLRWPLLSGRKSQVELTTGSTPISDMMKWPLLSSKSTMFDTELPSAKGGNGKSTGDSPVSKFIRGIVTGEPQK